MPDKVLEYNIRRFDVSKMNRDRSVIAIGGSGTGKTALTTALLYHNRDIPAGLVMSGSEAGDPYFRKFVPDIFVYNEFNANKIEDLIALQKRKKKSLEGVDANIEWCTKHGRVDDARRLHQKREREVTAMRKFVIIDDCMYNAAISRTETLRKLFFNGRHWHIFVILTVQYCMGLDIALRGNAGYVFVCREPIISYRKKIYESFLGILPNFKSFELVMNALTQNYEVLALDRTQISTQVEDCLFWYKAEPSYEFKIGSPRMWAYHHRHIDQNYDERLERQAKAKREQGMVRKMK